MFSLSWHVNLWTTLSVSCSDFYHETENDTLISRAICFQTPWMIVYYHKKSKSKEAPQKDLVLVEIWLLIVTDSEHMNLIVAWLVYTICILTFQMPSYMPNRDVPKKCHKNEQYWSRYCHLLLLTVVNSEQNMLDSDRNHWDLLHSNMVDGWIYI
jgi:hypothetical protein